MTNTQTFPSQFPPQHQVRQPGFEHDMTPLPVYEDPSVKGSGRLAGKSVIVTGGDSGIGRAVSVLFAKEGANVAVVYLDEHKDADETLAHMRNYGRNHLVVAADLGDENHCKKVVQDALSNFGKIDVLVNNIAVQYPQMGLEYITEAQLVTTFRTNVFSYFFMTKAALPHMTAGSCIINTTSVTAYEGNEQLVDYSATKGAIVTLTRSLAKQLLPKGIRVNAVAPGPIWTPLIPATFPEQQVATFGGNSPMKRAGQPVEVAPAYLYLASDDASYVTGQVLHVNGGTIVNG